MISAYQVWIRRLEQATDALSCIVLKRPKADHTEKNGVTLTQKVESLVELKFDPGLESN